MKTLISNILFISIIGLTGCAANPKTTPDPKLVDMSAIDIVYKSPDQLVKGKIVNGDLIIEEIK